MRKNYVFLFGTIVLSLVFSFLGARESRAACTEPQETGDYHVTESCAFSGTDNGIDNGDLYIDTNQTLTINSGQYVVWNSGKSVIINGTIQNDGGTLLQDDLWAVDADGDGCTPELTWYRTSNKPANSVKVSTLDARDSSALDTDDDNVDICVYSYAQSSYYRQSAYYRQASYYREASYYRYAQSAYYRYAQSAYYRYAQSAYYRYAQSSYYRQSSYSGWDSCFPANTEILMADGTTKPIQSVQPGDKVVSFDLNTNTKTVSTVEKLLTHPNTPGGYLILNGHLKVTGNHPIWSPSKKSWVNAEELGLGDSIFSSSGDSEIITSIQKTEGTNTVYNLHMQKAPYNFFAGGILVHNWK